MLWRDAAGGAHAWLDRCPHRGAALSLGRVLGDRLACPYHGWQFAAVDAQCVYWPAHPRETPPAVAKATTFAVAERYGLVWVRLNGDAGGEIAIPAFDVYDLAANGHYLDGPYEVEACAPRIVENFIDMAHFPFVHPGTLGDPEHTAVSDYEVNVSAAGVLATHCLSWQPQASGVSAQGVEIDYTFRVVHPLAAALSKLPGTPDAFDIMIVACPLDETHTRLWKIQVFPGHDPERIAATAKYSRAAILQDLPIVASQQPKRLPLDPRAELHQRADRLSAGYRRYLREIGWRYGVSL